METPIYIQSYPHEKDVLDLRHLMIKDTWRVPCLRATQELKGIEILNACNLGIQVRHLGKKEHIDYVLYLLCIYIYIYTYTYIYIYVCVLSVMYIIYIYIHVYIYFHIYIHVFNYMIHHLTYTYIYIYVYIICQNTWYHILCTLHYYTTLKIMQV